MSSTLDPDKINPIPAAGERSTGPGHDVGSLGPSDSSDSGSDLVGAPGLTSEYLSSDSDSGHTGEDTSVDETVSADSDEGFDRIVDASEAGLGTGLDEAEEALRDHPEGGTADASAGRAGRRAPVPGQAQSAGRGRAHPSPSADQDERASDRPGVRGRGQ